MPSRKQRQSRRQSRKQRQSRRQSRRSQRGGSSCAAMPLNREAFAQRGGMAPYSTGDATLLDKATMIQAQSWQQVSDIGAAQGLAKQAGGSRRKHRKGSRSAHRKGSRSAHRRSGRKGSRRQQRGGSYPWATGLQDFDKPYTLVPAGTATGVNPQFSNEGSVNPLYSETRGPQY